MIYSATIKDSQLYVVENIQFIYLIIFHYSGSRQDDNKPSLLRPAVSCHSHSIDKPSIRLVCQSSRWSWVHAQSHASRLASHYIRDPRSPPPSKHKTKRIFSKYEIICQSAATKWLQNTDIQLQG